MRASLSAAANLKDSSARAGKWGGRGEQDGLHTTMARRLPGAIASYILPIRRDRIADLTELTDYLRQVASWAQLIIIDASPSAVFLHHAELWSCFALHLPVAERDRHANGKASGVLTGFAYAEYEAIIIADDDVRYDERSGGEVVNALANAHVVRPQNYFEPLPWHAQWDTGRALINRALDGDWPGTLGVRRSAIVATRGYDADVLFENFELVRTIVAEHVLSNSFGFGGVNAALLFRRAD